MTAQVQGPVPGARLSAVLGLWLDRPPEEVLDTAVLADEAGFDRLWIGEMATWDAFALATAIAQRTSRMALMIGPLAVGARDPMMIAMGVASVRALSGRRVDVALGTSSRTVVERWHGREWRQNAARLDESIQVVRTLVDGGTTDFDGEVVSSHGYKLRIPAESTQIAVAAFGPRAIATAAARADHMVINMITPKSAARMRDQLDLAAADAGRTRPTLVAWLRAAIDPAPETIEQLRRSLVTYLGAPGYTDMFAEAGFGELAEYARTRPHPAEVLDAIPDSLVEAIGLVGDADRVAVRLEEYRAAGIDEIAVVPATAGDPGGARTLREVAALDHLIASRKEHP